jgi:hypothetical protein
LAFCGVFAGAVGVLKKLNSLAPPKDRHARIEGHVRGAMGNEKERLKTYPQLGWSGAAAKRLDHPAADKAGLVHALPTALQTNSPKSLRL